MNPQDQVEKFGVLFGQSWSFFKKHWQILVFITLIPSVIKYGSSILAQTHSSGLILLSVLLSIISGVVSLVMVVALVDSVHRLTNDPTTTITVRGQYTLGFKLFFPLLLVYVISGLATMGGLFIFIIPGIIISIYSCLSIYTFIIDGKRGFLALLESYSLVYGKGVDVFARLFIFGLIIGLFSIVISLFSAFIAWILGVNVFAYAQAHQQVPIYISLIGLILNLVVQSIIGPLAIIFSYRLYVSLKANRKLEVSTKKFKNWLVTFMIIGPIFFLIIVAGTVALFSLNTVHKLNQSSYSPYMDSQGTIQGNRPGGAGPGPTNP